MRTRYGNAILAAVVLALTSGPAIAGESEVREDHEIARSAFLRGEVMPIGDIVEVARTIVGDDLLRVELEREDERWIYEIKYVDETGHVRTLALDARSGKKIKVKDD